MGNELVEKQARLVAADNYRAEPDVRKVFWFPADDEVRLVELTELIPVASEGDVQPFYFRPSPRDDLPMPTVVAMIRPIEFGHLRLPSKWGDWSAAVLIEATG